jgi:signal transduction histidine kinase
MQIAYPTLVTARTSRLALTVALATATSVLFLGAVVLFIANGDAWWLLGAASVLVPLAAGVLVVLHRPGNVIGRLLLADAFLSALSAFVQPYARHAVVVDPGSLPGARYAALWDNASWPSLYASMVALVLFFPDGRLPARRWRAVAVAMGVCFAVLQAATLLEPQQYKDAYRGLTNPLPILPYVVRVSLTPFWIGAFASLFAAAWSVRLRFRRATGIERLQLLWLTYSAVLVPLALVVCLVEGLVWNAFGGAATTFVFVGALTAVPAGIAIAILRYRLFDIELILSRTLVFVVLTGSLVGGYLVLFLAFDRSLHLQGVAGVLAAALVALGFQPLRHVLQRRIERLVYGDRSDPYLAIARLGERLQAAPDPDDVLETIVDDVSRALRLGYCAIALRQEDRLEVAAARGRGERAAALELPLRHQGVDIGVLIAEPRPKSELSAGDRRLLEDLARQAGVAVHGVRVMADLQRSRESLVVAREEERLRLRRDLHDGLGPTLAALVFKIGSSATASGEIRSTPPSYCASLVPTRRPRSRISANSSTDCARLHSTSSGSSRRSGNRRSTSRRARGSRLSS